jgi:hypothetical protein
LRSLLVLARERITVRVITADRQFGTYLVEIDSSLNDQQRSVLDILLQMMLERYSELDPIRAGAFSVSEDATNALALESRVWTPVGVAVAALLTILISRDLRAAVAELFPPFGSRRIFLYFLA